MKCLPNEHIYSYLYRGYNTYGIDAYHTIFGSSGNFLQLKFIKSEYVKPFILPYDEIAKISLRSGYYCESLSLEPSLNNIYFEECIDAEFGLTLISLNKLKMLPLRIRYLAISLQLLKEIRFCPRCIDEFIREYGCGYLLSDWLSNEEECPKHELPLAKARPTNRKEAILFLGRILSGNDYRYFFSRK